MTMDGAAVQALINAAAPGTTVHPPPGEYQVDAVNAPITLKSNIALDLNGVTLAALGNNQTISNVVKISNCQNVSIIDGSVRGERDIHTGNSNWDVGGWGHGIRIDLGSRNINIRNTVVTRCFGDGVYIEDAYTVALFYVVCNGNRRQGMSVIHADTVYVDSCQFSNSGQAPNGTIPGCGIDWECDTDAERIINATVTKTKFFGNAGSCCSFGSPGSYHNIRVLADNSFDMRTQPIYAAGNAAPLGTSPTAFLLNRLFGWASFYRWWGYQTSWYRA